MTKNKWGRPTVMTEETLQKLDYAFSNSFTDEEASLYAGITPATLYNYCNDNPKYFERKELLKKHPTMKAKQNVVSKLNEKDLDTSKRYLERKAKSEFSTKQEVDLDGKLSIQSIDIKIWD